MIVTLAVVLMLPGVEKPVIYLDQMESIAECISAVREMTYRAPDELRNGGKFSAGCQVEIAKSENP